MTSRVDAARRCILPERCNELSAPLGRSGWWLALAGLAAMTEVVVGEHDRDHGLADRHGADADARVVAALGRDLGLVALGVDRLARREDRRSRLDRKARNHRLPRRDAAEDAAGVVRFVHGPPRR